MLFQIFHDLPDYYYHKYFALCLNQTYHLTNKIEIEEQKKVESVYTRMNYSFRKKNKTVKFIIIHYTGMKTLKSAYSRLHSEKSNVSAHYLISRSGYIFNLLCPGIQAWHAGKSQWKNDRNLNYNSIGIELENKGHEYGYNFFTKHQYTSLKKLIIFLSRNFYIKDEDIIFHSDISPNRKKDPGEKFFIEKIGIKKFKKNIQKKKINIQ